MYLTDIVWSVCLTFMSWDLFSGVIWQSMNLNYQYLFSKNVYKQLCHVPVCATTRGSPVCLDVCLSLQVLLFLQAWTCPPHLSQRASHCSICYNGMYCSFFPPLPLELLLLAPPSHLRHHKPRDIGGGRRRKKRLMNQAKDVNICRERQRTWNDRPHVLHEYRCLGHHKPSLVDATDEHHLGTKREIKSLYLTFIYVNSEAAACGW